MQVELSAEAIKLVDEYNESLKFKVSRTLVVNTVITESLKKLLKHQKPKKP